MQYTFFDEQEKDCPTLGQLKPGDFFVRNANKDRPIPSRRVYMKLHPHSRLNSFTEGGNKIACAAIHNGRLNKMEFNQPVLKIKPPLKLEIVEVPSI